MKVAGASDKEHNIDAKAEKAKKPAETESSAPDLDELAAIIAQAEAREQGFSSLRTPEKTDVPEADVDVLKKRLAALPEEEAWEFLHSQNLAADQRQEVQEWLLDVQAARRKKTLSPEEIVGGPVESQSWDDFFAADQVVEGNNENNEESEGIKW